MREVPKIEIDGQFDVNIFLAGPPLNEEVDNILDFILEQNEMGPAVGVDTVFGYADSGDAYQNECIDRARHNIREAIKAAVGGVTITCVKEVS